MSYHTSETTRQRSDEGNEAHCRRTYVATYPGIHVCGADHDENRFYTVLNVPARNDAEATAMWLAAREEAETADGEHELCVDLNTVEGHVDDFWTTRQMLPRLEQAILRTRSGDPS